MKTRKFDTKCKFRYNEIRSGDTRKGQGEHILHDRCIRKTKGDKKCLYPEKRYKECKLFGGL